MRNVSETAAGHVIIKLLRTSDKGKAAEVWAREGPVAHQET